MSVLTEIKITQFRNVLDAVLSPNAAFNLIWGENASGKTSILEAINLLSINRSFRTNNLQYLITHDHDELSVFSRLSTNPDTSNPKFAHKLGVARSRDKLSSFRIDGSSVARASDLALLLPVIAIQPSSFELIDGAPSHRRSLLDWLVFHVKHEFLECSRNYQRVLKQRNMLLRSGKIDDLAICQWNRLFIDEAIKIEKLRKPVLTQINQALTEILSTTPLLTDLGIELEYKSGWGQDHDADLAEHDWYQQRLEASFESDLRRCSTQIGSHRQDIRIRTKKGKASELLSRGQKKTLILAIYLCLADILNQTKAKLPVFLLDDLPSELDARHLAWLCERLHVLGAQSFISSVETESLLSLALFKENRDAYKTFHVKQGVVEPS